jgi:hypothetical protein
VAAPTFGAEGTDGRAPAMKVREDQIRGTPAGDIASGACGGTGGVPEEARRPQSRIAFFVAEGATVLDTWLPPTCKVGSGRGRDKSGRV